MERATVQHIPGQRLLALASQDHDLVVSANLSALLIFAIGKLVDPHVVKVGINQLHQGAVASQGRQRENQHQDAIGHEQRNGPLSERLFLASASAQLVVKRRIDVGQAEAAPRDLASQEAGRADVVAAWDEILDSLAPLGVQLHGKDVWFRNPEGISDLLDRLPLPQQGSMMQELSAFFVGSGGLQRRCFTSSVIAWG